MEKIYLTVAIPASLLLIVQTLMTFFGWAGEIDVDMNGDGDVDMTGESGMTLFSVRNLVAFFTFFGWSGLWMLTSDVKPVIVVLLSVLVGLLFMFVSMSLFYLVSKMQRSGTLVLNNAIGIVGEVYIRIPGNHMGYGKVMVAIQGALNEIEAITDETEDLHTGTQVEVIGVEGNSRLIVKKK